MDLVERAQNGDRRALGRLLTLVENRTAEGREVLRRLYPSTGLAHVVGVTGPPGSGKSTLVNEIALGARRRGRTVGIVAVDPTSPISGGAVLGDRIRMQELWQDPGIFIRSMASRNALGGLAETTGELVNVFDAVGKQLVIVETVGVGQAEVDVVREAHTTIVVVIPGMGDEIQAMKAGLMEIADLFVVNKADREGADQLVSQITQMLALGPAGERRPPILKTVATKGQGVEDLLDAVEAHWRFLHESGRLQRQAVDHSRRQLLGLVRDELLIKLTLAANGADFEEAVEAVAKKKTDPYTAADRLLEALFPSRE